MSDWPEGWRDVSVMEREGLASEIARELAEGHILKRRAFTVIARRDDQDDVLLALDDGEIAEMHLSWARETSPNFPGAMLFVDFAAWREAQV